MENNYTVSAQCYLNRAKKLLSSNKPENLVYSALELRAGIEARMQEYLEAQNHISNKMKKGWQIAHLGKNIEKAFKTGDKVAEIKIYDNEQRVPIAILYYTPITSELRSDAQRLGGYLHALDAELISNNTWWNEFRQLLKKIEKQLHEAASGVLLGPPIMQKSTNHSTMSISGISDRELKYLNRKMAENAHVTIKVDYLDGLPNNANSHIFLPKLTST